MRAALRARGLRKSSSAAPSMVTWYTRSKPVSKVEPEEPAGICVIICTFVPAAASGLVLLCRQPGASTVYMCVVVCVCIHVIHITYQCMLV
jgi:hypothetical protein